MENIEIKLGDKVINQKGVIGTVIREDECYWTLKYDVDGIIGGHVPVKTAVSKAMMVELLRIGVLAKLLPFEEIKDFEPGDTFTSKSQELITIVYIVNDTYIVQDSHKKETIMQKAKLHSLVSKGIFWKINRRDAIR